MVREKSNVQSVLDASIPLVKKKCSRCHLQSYAELRQGKVTVREDEPVENAIPGGWALEKVITDSGSSDNLGLEGEIKEKCVPHASLAHKKKWPSRSESHKV